MIYLMNPHRASFLAPIEKDLERVQVLLRDLSHEVHDSIRPLVEYSALDRGKMLRPTLLLLSGGAFGAIGPDHLRVAMILEVVHNATLLHDDVLDRGVLRRGVLTVNQRWGNRVAVRLGDILLGKVFEMNAVLPPPIRAVLGRMIRRTCEGEIHQTMHAGDFTLTEPQYLTIVGRKTAALFRGACYLGAQLAGAAASECRRAARFGYGAGMAYQIMDDLLDITGDGKSLRKTLGTDVRNAKLTLPLIHALRVLAEPRRASLLLALQQRRLDALRVAEPADRQRQHGLCAGSDRQVRGPGERRSRRGATDTDESRLAGDAADDCAGGRRTIGPAPGPFLVSVPGRREYMTKCRALPCGAQADLLEQSESDLQLAQVSS